MSVVRSLFEVATTLSNFDPPLEQQRRIQAAPKDRETLRVHTRGGTGGAGEISQSCGGHPNGELIRRFTKVKRTASQARSLERKTGAARDNATEAFLHLRGRVRGEWIGSSTAPAEALLNQGAFCTSQMNYIVVSVKFELPCHD